MSNKMNWKFIPLEKRKRVEQIDMNLDLIQRKTARKHTDTVCRKKMRNTIQRSAK